MARWTGTLCLLCICCVLLRTIIPFRIGIAGPYMACARLTSSLTTGQLINWLPFNALTSCESDGHSKICCRSQALYTPSISVPVKYSLFAVNCR